MAPTKSTSRSSKPSNKARKFIPPSSKLSSKSKSKVTRPPPKQQKTRPNLHNPSALKTKSKSNSSSTSTSTSAKRKAPQYSEKQLHLPALNTITPANAAPSAPHNLNSRGKKRKIFVDDEDGMRTILAIVQAEKEGNIESKMIRMRRLEEVREARSAEQEKKDKERRGVVEEVMGEIKRKRRRGKAKVEESREGGGMEGKDGKENVGGDGKDNGRNKKKKKVAFA